MPIHFRCTSCQQLLSIATRKAGAVVNCPTCDTRVIVPRQSSEPVKAAADRAEPAAGRLSDHGKAKEKDREPDKEKAAKGKIGAAMANLLEQGDFDALLKPREQANGKAAEPRELPAVAAAKPSPAPLPSSAPAPVSAPLGDQVDVELVPDPPPAGVILLTPARLTVAVVVNILLLGLAFLAGYLVRGG